MAQEMSDLEQSIKEWQQLKDWISTAKEREMLLRTSIVTRLFGAPDANTEGVRKIAKEGEKVNYLANITFKLHRTVLEEMIIPTWAEAKLTSQEAEGLVKYKPELSVSVYKKLPPAKRLIIDKMIVAKPGAPDLQVDILPKT